MPRKAAYNSRAERQRRAAVRSETLQRILDSGDAADFLVPLLQAWLDLQQLLETYQDETRQPYNVHEYVIDHGDPLRLLQAHCSFASAQAHVALAAQWAAQRYWESSSSSAQSAGLLVRSLGAAGNETGRGQALSDADRVLVDRGGQRYQTSAEQ